MTTYLNKYLQKIIEEYCEYKPIYLEELKSSIEPILRKLCFYPVIDFQYKFLKGGDDTYYRFYYYNVGYKWAIHNNDISHIENYLRDHLIFERELRDSHLGISNSNLSKTYIKW